MEQVRGGICITCLIISACFAHTHSTQSTYTRELFYNVSSVAFTSSVQGKTFVQRVDQCFLQCFETDGCISLLYRRDKTECWTFSGLLNDLPLDSQVDQKDAYFTKGAEVCANMGYTYEKTSSLCYKIHEDKAKHDDAATDCNDEGGRLVQIDSSRKQDIVETFVLQYGQKYRIDGNKVNGVWKFSSGAVIPHLYWHAGEPSNPRKECLTLNPDKGTKWNDVSCNNGKPYICEKLL